MNSNKKLRSKKQMWDSLRCLFLIALANSRATNFEVIKENSEAIFGICTDLSKSQMILLAYFKNSSCFEYLCHINIILQLTLDTAAGYMLAGVALPVVTHSITQCPWVCLSKRNYFCIAYPEAQVPTSIQTKTARRRQQAGAWGRRGQTYFASLRLALPCTCAKNSNNKIKW